MSDHPASVTRLIQRAPFVARELLAVCALPGAAILPLAVLHGFPWARSGGEGISQSGAAGVILPVLAIEACLLGALAAYAAAIVGRRRGRRFARSPWLLWAFGLVGGLVVALIGAPLVGLLGAIPLLLGPASLGIFWLAGLPCLAAYRMFRGVIDATAFACWVILAAIAGGGLGWSWVHHLDVLGWGMEGVGYFHLLLGPFFVWGAGLGAYSGYRYLGRESAAPSISAAGPQIEAAPLPSQIKALRRLLIALAAVALGLVSVVVLTSIRKAGPNPEVVRRLEMQLHSKDPEQRADAIAEYASSLTLDRPDLRPALEALKSDPSEEVRLAAIDTLLAAEFLVPPPKEQALAIYGVLLKAMTEDRSAQVRGAVDLSGMVIWQAHGIYPPEFMETVVGVSKPYLRKALGDSDPLVRRHAKEASAILNVRADKPGGG